MKKSFAIKNITGHLDTLGVHASNGSLYMFQMGGDAYIGTYQQNSDWNDVKYKFNVGELSSTLIKLF